MSDSRLQQLANKLVSYSIDVQPGENVLVELIGTERELVSCIVNEIVKYGGHPFVQITDPSILRELLLHATEKQIKTWQQYDLLRMKNMHGYIGIQAGENANELIDVPKSNMEMYERLYTQPIHIEQRVKKKKWVVLRYPNASMAQLAHMSTESFKQFYFHVCNIDYEKLGKAMRVLKSIMDRTEQVHLVGPETDLCFSIKGMNAVICSGKRNIPDGEIYTAPIRDSINGTLSYNTSSIYNGFTFENVKFHFENGKIVFASSNDTTRLNEILDIDEGARYIGEFAIGLNPYLLHPIKDTLFDEKITGSIHFTPGQAYECADNGNRSSIHWDLVLIQRPEYGGGELYFDHTLIRKDGRFVLPALYNLNVENLE